jgi:F-type H+-transporting ATPase subunit epsilon
MGEIKLKIVSPDETVIEKTVETVVVPGYNGDFGVLPGHTEFLTLLREGTVSYVEDTRTYSMKISGGFAEVMKNHVKVLADSVEKIS